jgi:hypothetical protein
VQLCTRDSDIPHMHLASVLDGVSRYIGGCAREEGVDVMTRGLPWVARSAACSAGADQLQQTGEGGRQRWQ